ncbi:MAG TPA: ATP-binding protein [Thermoanaerobaculia bacterium]|nr:ATP-binding protein [Thermoanaerobaculia bacterium]
MAPTRGVDDRILILAPTGKDAELAAAALRSAAVHAEIVPDVESLCEEILRGAGAAIVTDEALDRNAMRRLHDTLLEQAPWSDFPLLIFTSRPSSEDVVRSFDPLGPRANITLIERPIRVKTMISAAQAALRARRRQYEVKELVFELERRVTERDNFLAMLSHELRNPLAAISLAVDSLGAEADGVSNEYAILVRQTRHLAKLVDDLLDIARVTTGKISLHRTEVDLADIAEHCVETMRPRAEGRRLHLSFHHTHANAIVYGDGVRLEQIVNNLLSNAIKYTPPGGDVEVFVEADADEVTLRVRDTGKGISPELLSRIFDLFMQGDVTLDRTEGGMGVGLSLVRKLVDLHRGTVRAYSRGRGDGSEFVVRFPLALSQQQRLPAPANTHAEAQVNGAKRRILVIEDNSDIRDLLRLKLRQLGHAVDAAEDGTRGLQKLLTAPPEIALVDIGLPGIDGYEIARQVRERVGADIYLVALTGYGQVEDKKKALAAGFDVHLTKPADFSDLQRILSAEERRHPPG